VDAFDQWMSVPWLVLPFVAPTTAAAVMSGPLFGWLD
jgi:hypothetical protein